jgi:hypothetical protein
MPLALDDERPVLTPKRRDAIAFRNKLVLASKSPELQNKIVSVAGRKGSGKSTVTRELLGRNRRLFLFDTMGEHHWIPNQFDDMAEAHSFIFEHGASGEFFQASFVPAEVHEGSLESSFGEISMAVYQAGNMTYAVEELPMLSQPNWVPPTYNTMVRLGRHRCINLLYTGQRLSECPRRVTSATDVFVLFSHTEPRDLDSIAERCGPEVAELVKQLGEHEFLVYDVATRQVLIVDSEWYDAVLSINQQWTPAIGGRNGRPALWSLDDYAE